MRKKARKIFSGNDSLVNYIVYTYIDRGADYLDFFFRRDYMYIRYQTASLVLPWVVAIREREMPWSLMIIACQFSYLFNIVPPTQHMHL